MASKEKGTTTLAKAKPLNLSTFCCLDMIYILQISA
jgi:hypothetical protein